LSVLPPHNDDGRPEKNIGALFRAAVDVVLDNFHAADHLPKAVYDFLLPISTSTCQGLCHDHALPRVNARFEPWS